MAVLTLALCCSCGGGGSSSPQSIARAQPGPLPNTPVSAGPSSAPPVPVAAATPAAANAGLSDAGFATIVNGQAWPAAFRPYSANPWNALLPANPTVDSTNTANVRNSMSDTVDHITGDTHNDYSHPVFLAAASDPLVTVNCASMQYGCFTDQSGSVSSLPAINIPALARPAGGTDAHFAVVQTSGAEYDFWQTAQPSGNWTNGATLSAGIAVQTSIQGTGVPGSASATSGAALAAGLIRFDELARRTIPHAIFLDFPCTQGVEYPGTTGGAACSGGGVPMGALVYLTLTIAQIDALPATTIAPYLRPILYALHQYGGYAEDTYGGGSNSGAPFWEYESFTQYSAMGLPYPGTAFALANGYSSYQNPFLNFQGGPIRWSQLAPYIEVLASCYAHGPC